jgi:hypothetical protein
MSWLARFAGWSALLSAPAWLLMPAYQRALGRLASLTLRLGGLEVEFDEVMVAAPIDLALFAAMCLASLHAPRPRRFRALLMGLPLLVVGEIAVVVVVVLLSLAAHPGAAAASHTSRAGEYLTESIPWVNAALAWLFLLGQDELPELSRPAAKRSGVRMAR